MFLVIVAYFGGKLMNKGKLKAVEWIERNCKTCSLDYTLLVMSSMPYVIEIYDLEVEKNDLVLREVGDIFGILGK